MNVVRAGKADYRAMLLLLLSFVPIIGALAGSVAYWKDGQRELEQFVVNNDPVEITYLTHALVDDYQMAYLALEAAAWPEADDSAIALAEVRKAKALTSLDSTEAQIGDVATRIANDLGLDSETFLSMLTDLLNISRRGMLAQVPGEPIGSSLDAGLAVIAQSLQGRAFPAQESSDGTLRLQRQLLYEFFAYHAELAEPINSLFSDLSERTDPSFALLKSSINTSNDDEIRNMWGRVRFSQTVYAAQETLELSAPEYASEPFKAQIEALRLGDNERSLIASDLLTFMDLLRNDTDAAYAASEDRIVELTDQVRTRQQLLTALGGLLALLGVGLLALTTVEIRHRRSVEEEHRLSLDRLDDKAQTDPLTGAWNRRRFDRVLQRYLNRQDANGPVILAYVDLDRFKALNDVWGRATGDQALQIIARRLQNIEVAGQKPEVIRFGGDEFICFVSKIDASAADASAMGEQLLSVIRQPIVVKGERHLMTATAGVAVSDRATTPDSLLLEADRSLMLGKRVQRGSVVTSDEHMADSNRLVKMLPWALQSGEITCHFQPVFCIATGEMLHVEALSRWNTRDGESISPGTFVPLVETFGLSSALTRSVLRSISEVMHHEAVPDHIGFWLNVAPVELEEFDFADRILDDLATLNLPAERLAIEITETAAISDPAHFAEQVSRLRDVGIEIAIDDFGSGYSPLGYLQDLPIDVVKIDRSLIAHIDTHKSNQQLLTGIIGMLQTQGRAIVAEGVERTEELDWLRERGVDMVQGYLTARPAAPCDLDWPAARVDVAATN